MRFGTGYPYSDRIKPKILGLHTFGLSTLVGIPDGKTLVCHAGEGDWRAEAYFVAEGGRVTRKYDRSTIVNFWNFLPGE